MKTLIIAGGTGFLGTILVAHFKSKFTTIYVLTRGKEKTVDNIQYIPWDANTPGLWAQYIDGSDVLINLTGKSVDCRYTPKNKEAILNSRVHSTTVLGEIINMCQDPPKVWLNASTATIYRHSLDKEMDETSGEIGTGFSVDVAQAWEYTFFKFNLPNTRQVALRTSIVLGENGGAFVPIKKLTSRGLGGKQGNGNQKVSWIHQEDFARSIAFIINSSNLIGPINIVSPKPTTNSVLMKKMRTKLRVPLGIPMPKALLEFGAKIIKTETELILKSRNVIPKRLTDLGFTFNHPSISGCIDNLLN
ncbi:MAG: TIGR01777 family oxidoreductase [Bacteroidetes bacterium]|nr:TIGR01777 family oxidoreductase [Bacteroidota bacterium]